MKHLLALCLLAAFAANCLLAQDTPQRRRRPLRQAFETDTLLAHDPVLAWENGLFYLYSTGMGVQVATSRDLRTWTVQPRGALTSIPAWTHDSVPGFRGHVWAPDVIHYRGRWWMAYSCSTFGRNTSAIGLASSPTLDFTDTLLYRWQDEGALVCSRERRDAWNAIDPNIVLDASGHPWLTWGSFWDGIQLVRLNPETMHVAEGEKPLTIARRVALKDTLSAEPNPTSRYAGRNAIEAPFITRHADYYYLFVSHDYCCRGMKSNYKVVVGRSRNIQGPYLDRQGRDMASGGGTLVIEGDKVDFEAAGHSAFYHILSAPNQQKNQQPAQQSTQQSTQQPAQQPTQQPAQQPAPLDLFICHGYSTRHNGQAILVQRPVRWTADGWPELGSWEVEKLKS